MTVTNSDLYPFAVWRAIGAVNDNRRTDPVLIAKFPHMPFGSFAETATLLLPQHPELANGAHSILAGFQAHADFLTNKYGPRSYAARGVGAFTSSPAEMKSFIGRVNASVESFNADMLHAATDSKNAPLMIESARSLASWRQFYNEWHTFYLDKTTGPLDGWTSLTSGVYEETQKWQDDLNGWRERFAGWGGKPMLPPSAPPPSQGVFDTSRPNKPVIPEVTDVLPWVVLAGAIAGGVYLYKNAPVKPFARRR